eukprot:scaffold228051_cov46-Prasinocladus_malaysianus.AAC.1
MAEVKYSGDYSEVRTQLWHDLSLTLEQLSSVMLDHLSAAGSPALMWGVCAGLRLSVSFRIPLQTVR